MQLSQIVRYVNSDIKLARQYTPEIHIFETPEEVDAFAAAKIIEQTQIKPDSVLTLPTGSTPINMYKKIVRAYKQGKVDLHAVTVFNLDEYYPIAHNHPNSYASYMKEHLIDHVPVGRWHILNGEAKDPEQESERYEELMENFPVDLAVLGIGPGTTCHIGFNEKGSSIDSSVRYVPLHPETRESNAKQFKNPQDIPNGALTQGVVDILQAEQILMIAKGASKAWGIQRTLEGPVSSEAPASFLRLHPNVIFALDKDAANVY